MRLAFWSRDCSVTMMMPSQRVKERAVFVAQTLEIDRSIVVQCRGRLVRSDAAFQLRNAVQSNRNASSVILDFTELEAIDGGALGMLTFLQRWTEKNSIPLIILRPTARVEKKLKDVERTTDGKFNTERGIGVMRLVGFPEREHWVASSLAA